VLELKGDATRQLSNILPATARCDEAGHLEVGGCDVVALAERFGTPLYVYDLETARSACRAYTAAFARHLDDFGVVYAGKAFLCRAWCQVLEQEGLGLDVASGGELWMAHAAGFPLEHVFVHGNNKTAAELELALQLGVGHVVVDSLYEIELLSAMAEEHGRKQRVLLRLGPGVRPSTHRYMQTGHDGSKFGVALSDGLATAAVRAILASPHLILDGVHAHIGSQICETAPFEAEIGIIMAKLAEWRGKLGLECGVLDMGGGLGVPYSRHDAAPSIAELADVVSAALRRSAQRYGIPLPRLLIEPGRSIIARAGLTAYRVGSLKTPPGSSLYVAVDGGMSDNIRPMLYQCEYDALIANRASTPATVTAAVVGKHCESGDFLIQQTRIAEPEPGDTLVTPNTGAYGFSMASNYNGQPRSAVVFVEHGHAQLVVERETWADVARTHLALEPPMAGVQEKRS